MVSPVAARLSRRLTEPKPDAQRLICQKAFAPHTPTPAVTRLKRIAHKHRSQKSQFQNAKYTRRCRLPSFSGKPPGEEQQNQANPNSVFTPRPALSRPGQDLAQQERAPQALYSLEPPGRALFYR